VLAAAQWTILPSASVAAQSIVPVYEYLRLPKVARQFAEEGVAAAERSGFAFVSTLWRVRLGWAIAHDGNPEAGVAMIRAALKEVPFLDSTDPLAAFAVSLTGALSMACLYGEAVVEADRCLVSRSNVPRALSAEAFHLKGEIILGQEASATGEAEPCFRRAIEIARGQCAKWWELRATTNLTRLLRNTNRRDEGRGMLAEIYNWFTEGFDTSDLRNAKALLDEMSGSP
jgi:hypothetical protein